MAQTQATIVSNAVTAIQNFLVNGEPHHISNLTSVWSGDHNKPIRQGIIHKLTGEKRPVAKCGITVIQDYIKEAIAKRPVELAVKEPEPKKKQKPEPEPQKNEYGEAMLKAYQVYKEMKEKEPDTIFIVEHTEDTYLTFGKDAETVSKKLMISTHVDKDLKEPYCIVFKNRVKEKTDVLKTIGRIALLDKAGKLKGKQTKEKPAKEQKPPKPATEPKAVLGYRVRFQHGGKLHNWLRAGNAEKAAVLENSTAILKELYPDMGKVEIREMTQIEFDLMKR